MYIAAKSVPLEAHLSRANGFRRKLLLTFDVVSLRFDYFALHKTTSSNRDIFHKARFRWCKSLSGIKAKSKKTQSRRSFNEGDAWNVYSVRDI